MTEATVSSAAHADDVTALAVHGVALVGVRGLVIRVIALGGTIVLARLLTPHEFGLVAFGMAFVTVGRYLADAGLAAALIRSADEPEPADIAAAFAAQLGLTLVVAAAVGIAAPFTGTAGRVTAVMVSSLPILALRTPMVVVLERRLVFRPIVGAEMLEVLASMATSIALVAAGLGVYGLAVGPVAGALVGTGWLRRSSGVHVLAPRPSWPRLRRMLAIGVAFQAVGVLGLVRDQGLNLGTFAISGAGVLGLWTLGYRVLQAPFLVFEGMWRVSFPAMSRLVATGRDAGRAVERGLVTAGVGTGAILSLLLGGAPSLLPVIFGHRWQHVVAILPGAGLSLLIGGPISAAGAGYLYAVGDAARVVRATVLHTVLWLAVGLSLLPAIGVGALGWGWLAGGLAETVLFARGLRKHAGVSVWRPIMTTSMPAILGAGAGWAVASAHHSLVNGILGALLAEAIFVLVMTALDRRLLRDTARLAMKAVRRPSVPASEQIA